MKFRRSLFHFHKSSLEKNFGFSLNFKLWRRKLADLMRRYGFLVSEAASSICWTSFRVDLLELFGNTLHHSGPMRWHKLCRITEQHGTIEHHDMRLKCSQSDERSFFTHNTQDHPSYGSSGCHYNWSGNYKNSFYSSSIIFNVTEFSNVYFIMYILNRTILEVVIVVYKMGRSHSIPISNVVFWETNWTRLPYFDFS